MRNYFVLDGRANYDIDRAVVMEAFEAKNNKEAKKYFKREYQGHDYVLVDDVDNIIHSLQIVWE